jgi:ferritin
MKQREQQILKWFLNEQKKDELEVKSSKQKIINELKGIKKEDMFKKEQEIVKLTLWQRIKITLLGN